MLMIAALRGAETLERNLHLEQPDIDDRDPLGRHDADDPPVAMEALGVNAVARLERDRLLVRERRDRRRRPRRPLAMRLPGPLRLRLRLRRSAVVTPGAAFLPA